MTHNFQPWPKIARLNRDIVITEKLDGTNAAVGVEEIPDHLCVKRGEGLDLSDFRQTNTAAIVEVDQPNDDFGPAPSKLYWVWAQSRKRVITPGKSTDNAGFAGWVAEHADDLVRTLGEGLHFGEWWGRGIQRGYDQEGKTFSLFNTARYGHLAGEDSFEDGTRLNSVPVLYSGMFGEFHIQSALLDLSLTGSKAAPGFMRPEGIIVYHTAASEMFKVTIEGDESPKGLMQNG